MRKRQNQSSIDATQDSNKHSLIWRMFMSSTLEASIFMGKNYSENLRSIKNTVKNFTMKQMCDISEKLMVGQSDDIYGLNPINCEDSSWKQLSLVSDEELISLKIMNRNANLTPISFLSMQEDFHQENGHSLDLDQRRSRILLLVADHKENGTESLN